MEIKRYWWVGYAKCIGFQNGTTNGTITCWNEISSDVISVVALIFDLFSIFGSSFIIGTYFAFHDLRTRARLILFMISVADLIAALAYGIAFIYSIINKEFSACYDHKPELELTVCIIQATVSNFANNSSIIWTALLGLHITMLFFRSKRTLFMNNKYFILINVFAWGLPLGVAVVGLFLNIFGPGSQNVNTGWCFISSYYKLEPNTTEDDGHFILQLFTAKLWEMLIFLFLIITYSFSCYRVCKQNRINNGVWRFSNSADLRLIWIPIVFFLLKAWGNIRWILTLIMELILPYQPIGLCEFDLVLSFLQAIGDPGQGWANALLYILFNEVLRKRIWNNFKIYFCLHRQRRIGVLFNWNHGEKSHLVTRERKETPL